MNSNTAFWASLARYEICISLKFQLAVIKKKQQQQQQQQLIQRYHPFIFSSIFLNFVFFFFSSEV